MSTICLNMIVKNESKIIKRLLDSVKDIIDSCCICDTGSSDNTIEIIREWMSTNNKTGVVIEEPFKNFAYNRTFAIKHAQSCIKADYLLLLDADMRLVTTPKFTKNILTAPAYSIIQKTSNLSYHNLRLIKMTTNVVCVGVTHEYYDIKGPTCTLGEDLIYISDIGDGGSKTDKFTRDIKLLKEGIQDPETTDGLKARYYFYLANTYSDIGQYESAIETYKLRINAGGWYEEVWYSKYRLGICLLKLHRITDGIFALLDAYEYHPKRAESLYEVIKAYRIMGKHNLAYMVYKTAKAIPYPKDDLLFINHNVYKFDLDYELSIIGYYVKHPDIDKLITNLVNNMPYVNFNHMMTNYRFYSKNLITNTTKVIDLTSECSSFPDFKSSTPTIVKYVNNNYIVLVRYVNYFIKDDGTYVNKEKITTHYRVVILDEKLKTVSDYPLEKNIETHLRYQGIEDVRLFDSGKSKCYRFSGTMQTEDEKITVGVGVYNPKSKRALEYNPIVSPFDRSCEKNWCMFLDKNGNTRILYEWDNFKTYNLGDDNTISDYQTTPTPSIFKHLRGSTNGVGDDNYRVWFIAHLVCFEGNKRVYYHVFILYNTSTHSIRHTTPFKFEGANVEYTLGLVIDKEENFIISYSTNDSTSKLAIVSKSSVERMLI